MNDSAHTLPLSALQLSHTVAQRERRAHFDKASITELAESIKTVGLLQPLVVRPIERSKSLNYLVTDPTHQVVAGERRFLAAKQAGLEEVPVTVRELTDEQVLEVQLVENLQRADVHPMAEAEGYEGLHKLGRTVDEIADKVGKSKAYVYARMKLLELTPAGRKAFYAGKLTASTALYVARVPKALQDQALNEITSNSWNGPMSARHAQEHIQRNYMLRLADASFPTKDAELVPAAGPCGSCPKRTGNQAELFADVKSGDVCTDPACYRQKAEAHMQRAIARARESGQTVLTGPKAKAVAPNGSYSLKGYVKLDDHNYDNAKNRTWRQILGKSYVPTLLVDDKRGELVEIAPESDLPKEARRKAGSDRYQAQRRSEERKRDLELKYRQTLFLAVREASRPRPALDVSDLRRIAARLFDTLSHDDRKRLAKALDWPVQKSKHHAGVIIELPCKASEMSAELLVPLLRDLSLAHQLHTWTYGTSKPEILEAFAAEIGVDAKAIRGAVVAEQKAADKAKVKRKGKAK